MDGEHTDPETHGFSDIAPGGCLGNTVLVGVFSVVLNRLLGVYGGVLGSLNNLKNGYPNKFAHLVLVWGIQS